MTPMVRGERWPDAMAGAITLLEIAFGPEITEEAFALLRGPDTFEMASRQVDAKAKRPEDFDLKRLRHLLEDDVSLPAAWAAMQKGRPTPGVTVEAIKQAVREGGADALEENSISLKLQSCDHPALADLDCWLLKRGVSK